MFVPSIIENSSFRVFHTENSFAWEKPMLAKLSEARNDRELKNLVKVRFYNQVSNFVWSLIPILMNLLCFGSYVLTQKKPLTSDIVFPALSLLSLVSNPILELSTQRNQEYQPTYRTSEVRVSLYNLKKMESHRGREGDYR